MVPVKLNPFDTVCAARLGVYKRLPYFMRMLFKLAPVEAPGCGTFYVDGKLRVHYDPAKVLEWGVELCATFLAHEVQHPLREHERRGLAYAERNEARWNERREALAQMHPLLGQSYAMFWNVVCDAEINPVLDEVGFKFPADFAPVYPATFQLKGNRCAEEYADELLDRAQQQQQSGKQKQQPTGSPTADGAGNSSHVGSGQCGGCAGHKHEHEGTTPEEDMPRGATSTEVEVARRQVAHDTLEPTPEMQRLMQQFGIGKVPGAFEQWAQAQLAPPAVPWQKVLAPLVRNAVAYARGRMDWKFGRPSRRREVLKQAMGDSAPLLPTLVSHVPNVGIVVDTSGSMQSRGRREQATMLDDALSEVVGIVAATGAPCWAAAVDAGVQEWVRVRDRSDVQRLVKGGGGTDMRVGIKAAEERKFDVIVLLTDGWTPWPTQQEMPRRARLVVCCTSNAEVPTHVGTVVRVTPKEVQ